MVAMVLSVIAFILTIYSSYACNYMRIDGFLYPSFPYHISGNGGRYGVGLLSFQSPDAASQLYCYLYTVNQADYLFDPSFKAARAFGVIANISSGIAMIALFLIACLEYSKCGLLILGGLSIVASMSSALTFLFFNSALASPPYNGTFSVSAGLAIGGLIFSAATAFVVCKLPPAEDPFEGQPEPAPYAPGTETITETKMPDGSKKVTKTTVNPDGSKTIEETVYPPPADA